MKIWRNIKELKAVRNEIKDLSAIKDKPRKLESIGLYFKYIGYSWKLNFKEQELFLFTLLQWTSIALGYYLFVMMLFWIPEEVWRSTENSDEGSIADLILFAWMIVCIGVAALPLGIFSACMATVHMLHIDGKNSTIARCLQIVLPRTWSLWMFHWLDGYITVNRIIERLPKKNDRTPRAKKILGELLYYAWKIATMGILPNLITGRGIKDTTKNTVNMIKSYPLELTMVRAGYSLCCWIVAILTYVLGILNFSWIKETFLPGEIYENVGEFYLIAGIPMLVSVAFIQLFLRPPYLLAISDIYARFIADKDEELFDHNPPPPAVSAFITFAVFCLILFVVYLYRYQFGIMDMLATPYGG